MAASPVEQGGGASKTQDAARLAHKPHIEKNLSITIAGPPIFPAGEETNYILQVTLHYHHPPSPPPPPGSTAPAFPPITLKEDSSPLSTAASMTGTYLLYPSSPPNTEPVNANWWDFEVDDRPTPVSADKGFSTLYPGESVTRQVTVVPACFDTQPGAKYVLRMPEGNGRIEWWGVGDMKAFEGLEVRPTEWSGDGGLACRGSNAVEVLAEG